MPASDSWNSSVISAFLAERVLLLIFDKDAAGCILVLEPHSCCIGTAAGAVALSMLAKLCCSSA